jgi:ATP-dependent DNA ligase
MVAKDPRSVYRSGGTRSWVKVKVRREGVFVVGGIRDVNAFDGVLVGERVGDELHYRGVVEGGFKAPDVVAILEQARRWSRPSSPFVDLRPARSVTWVEPRLEAEVSYAELVEGPARGAELAGTPRLVLAGEVTPHAERSRCLRRPKGMESRWGTNPCLAGDRHK